MKLCEMVPFNDKIEGDDCFTLAISNILRYKGFTNYQSVYKQCAIVYYEGENNSLPLIRSRFMNITEELYFGHKIRIKKHKIEQPELFLTLIRSWIKQNEPVLIGVDPFYLPFSLHYQDRHTLHYITAIDFTKNMINIVDDSYNIKQEISDSVLLQSTQDIQFNRHFFTLHAEEAVGHICRDSIFNVIRRNVEVNQECSKIEKMRELENLPRSTKVIVGIPGLHQFIVNLESFVNNSACLAKSSLFELGTILSRMATSRYRYAHFLRNSSVLEAKLIDLAESYFQLGQDWTVATNMIFKSSFMKNDVSKQAMLARMIKKLKEIALDEEISLTKCEALILKL